jgi:hypothetical protein
MFGLSATLFTFKYYFLNNAPVFIMEINYYDALVFPSIRNDMVLFHSQIV